MNCSRGNRSQKNRFWGYFFRKSPPTDANQKPEGVGNQKPESFLTRRFQIYLQRKYVDLYTKRKLLTWKTRKKLYTIVLNDIWHDLVGNITLILSFSGIYPGSYR